MIIWICKIVIAVAMFVFGVVLMTIAAKFTVGSVWMIGGILLAWMPGEPGPAKK
jgi:hypothetical protein